MAKIELLTSPTCPHCPEAREVLKKWCKEKGMKLIEISTASQKGRKWANKFGVTGTPSFVLFGTVRPVLKTGVPTRAELEDMLALANGEKQPKESFIKRLVKIFTGE